MTDHLLPDGQADGLVDGTLHDAPLHFRGAADVLAAARQPATAAELAGMSAVVQRFAAAAADPVNSHTRSRSMRGTRITRRAAVAVVATLLTAGTAAAAAGGVLPSPFEGTSDAVVDSSSTEASTTAAATTVESATTEASTTADPGAVQAPIVDGSSTTDDQVGPDATGPAAFGLCTAWTHGAPKHTDNPAFGALQRAADAAGQSIDDYCATVLDATHSSQETTEPTDESTEPTDAQEPADDQASSHHQGSSHDHGGRGNSSHGKGNGHP